MDIASYVLLSQEQALRRRLDVAANNMANMNTAGFKREQPVFHEYVETGEAATSAARPTSYVLDYGAVHDVSAGAFQPTGNPLDVMIDGPGYFAVEAPGGGTAYTRAGYIKVAQDGSLVTAGGQRILGEGGKPITVAQEDVATLQIEQDGTVTAQSGQNGQSTQLGRIAVTVFDSESSVNPRGDGMFTAQGGRELAAAQTRLKSGGIEGSNVNPLQETTDMVEILRAYQNSQRMTESMSDIRKKAIDQLSKVN